MRQFNGKNPFQTLYLSEALEDPDVYRDLFSNTVITGETQSLFRVGNIVLLGSNGAGKTMLLRMFSPDVQAAFLRRHQVIPVPQEDSRFVGIGINFVHAGFGALGQRRLTGNEEEDLLRWQLYFSDLLNYLLVKELLQTLHFITTTTGKALAEHLGLAVTDQMLQEYSGWLSQRDCWFGALQGTTSFEQLLDIVEARIRTYRAFANWNIPSIPEEISSTKTDIGLPLEECRRGMQDLSIIPASIPLMVTIDQYETLLHIDYEHPLDADKSLGRTFCRVVNSFVARRSPLVSYKIGVRPYAWYRELRCVGTDARLELGRDYQIVSLDEVLQRKENTAAWIFPKFADDVAQKRMKALFKSDTGIQPYLDALEPEGELSRYCRKDENRLVPKNGWPEEWNVRLREIYRKSKFEAKLAEVWLHQFRGRTGGWPDLETTDADSAWRREWWQKERTEAVLTQVASECRQRRLYGGWDTLLTLSASNILVFLNLCREVWDIWQRAEAKAGVSVEKISPEIQSQAIRVVSGNSVDKLNEFPDGAKRRDFLTRLGIGIRKALLADKGLVYPGHTGFSLLQEEYESARAQSVRDFLDNAADFGALVSFPHTTKERDRLPRKKWYIFPALCPQFEIPAVRTKEPYYATLEEVQSWLSEARPAIEFRRPGERKNKGGKKAKQTKQSGLFSKPEGPGEE